MDKRDKIIKPSKQQLSALRANEHEARNESLNHAYDTTFKCQSIRSVNISRDNRYLLISNAGNPRLRVIDSR